MGIGQRAHDGAWLEASLSKSIDQFAKKKYYDTRHFDLSDLPAYVPEQKITGPIRIWGSDKFGGAELKRNLQAGFRKYHPQASFVFDLRGPAMAFAGFDLPGDSRTS